MPRPTPTRNGSLAAAGTCRTFPNGTPRARGPRRDRPRPPGLPAEPRRPLDVGQQPGPGARRNHASTPDPDDGRIERDPDGTPTGTLHEGAADLVERLLPAHTDDEWLEAFGAARRTSTRSGSRPGRTRSSRPTIATYRRAAETGLLTARVEARCGGSGSAASSRSRSSSGVARSRPGRFRANSVKLMLDGVIETFTAAMIDPYLDADGAPTDESRHRLHRSGRPREIVTRLDGPAPVALPCARRRGGPVRARRRRGSPGGERDVRHTAAPRPHPGRPSRRRAALRAPRRGRQRPAVVGLPEPQMDELTIPFLGRSGRRGSTRSRRCCAPARGSPWARTGRSRRRTRCWRSKLPSTASVDGGRQAGRSCPTSG